MNFVKKKKGCTREQASIQILVNLM